MNQLHTRCPRRKTDMSLGYNSIQPKAACAARRACPLRGPLAWLFCLLAALPLSAQLDSLPRPKIGYALSGGAVKGIAEIGMLKVLEEEGIYPDCITGTSIGSIVGGLYAMGYNAADLAAMARRLDWGYFFNDDWPRTVIPPESRALAERYQLRFVITRKGLKLPRSFVFGEKIALLFSQLTIPAHGITDFDQLTIPFRCISTDFATGQAVVLGKGDLGHAMRASMSLPSIFEPVEIDGRLLIDGGAARNLPVQDVRDMGAQLVIAMDVGNSLYTKEELTSVLQLLDQTISYRIDDSNKKQLELADIVIKPDLTGIGPLSFDKIDTLLARGEAAARAALPEIRALLGRYKSDKIAASLPVQDSFYISDYRIESGNARTNRVIANVLQLKVPGRYASADIERRVSLLYGDRWVRLVNYRLLPLEDGTHQLVISAVPPEPAYLKVSANYDTDLKAGLLFNATLRNQIINGSRLSVDVKVSENPALIADYTIHTISRPSLGLRLGARAHYYPAFTYEEGKRTSEFKLHHYQSSFDLFTRLSQNTMLSAGIADERFVQNRTFFDPTKDEIRFNQSLLQLALTYDTYDRLHFPRKGSQLIFTNRFAFGGSLERRMEGRTVAFNNLSTLLRLQYSKVFELDKKWSLAWHNDGGWMDYKRYNFIYMFYLGRGLPGELTHVPFTGLRYMAEPATRYGITGLQLRWEPKADIFTSLTANYGYIQQELPSVQQFSLYGIGLELGMFTIVGPVRLTVEYGNRHSGLVTYLHMGYVF